LAESDNPLTEFMGMIIPVDIACASFDPQK
jgi:hypothetical protein